MATSVDREALCDAYQDVRADGSDTNWALFRYEGTQIVHDASGVDLTELRDKLTGRNDNKHHQGIGLLLSRHASDALLGYECIKGDFNANVGTHSDLWEEVIGPLVFAGATYTDDDRAFAFVRVLAGDEMSKRKKFVLLTWVGSAVSPLKRARVSIDKALVKQIVQNFAVELQLEAAEELNEDFLRAHVEKAGGANYGTGSRN